MLRRGGLHRRGGFGARRVRVVVRFGSSLGGGLGGALLAWRAGGLASDLHGRAGACPRGWHGLAARERFEPRDGIGDRRCLPERRSIADAQEDQLEGESGVVRALHKVRAVERHVEEALQVATLARRRALIDLDDVLRRDVREALHRAGGFGDREVAKLLGQAVRELLDVVTAGERVGGDLEANAGVPLNGCEDHPHDAPPIDEAERLRHSLRVGGVACEAEHLIREAERIAHAPFRGARDEGHGAVVEAGALLAEDLA